MSHNVAVKNLVIPNISVIERAIRELARDGAPITISDAPGKFVGYQGRTENAERVIKVTGSTYEIGVVPTKGGFTLSYDQMMCHHDPAFLNTVAKPKGSFGVDGKSLDSFYSGEAGESIGRLVQLCNVIAAEDQAGMEGHMCSRSYDERTKQYVLEIEGVG